MSVGAGSSGESRKLASEAAFPRGLLLVLAVCAGASVANLYYAQPLLAQIAGTFDVSARIGWVAVAPMVGYTVSLVSILPLGDLVDRRRLSVVLACVMAVGAFACAIAPSLVLLAVACGVLGFGAVITQILLPMSADIVQEPQRARALGIVFSGVLAGILAARTLSGFIGQAYGWRTMFFVASFVAISLALTLGKALPKSAPKAKQSYLSLFTSMWQMLRQHAPLRSACLIQGCLFGVFTAFWSVLALLLASPPFEMGAAVAGSFGIVGIVGVIAANLSGRIIERFGSANGRLFGIGCCLFAYVVFAVDISLRGLVIGVILMDFGLSIANVSSQNTILGLESAARNRINTLYVTSIFLGGSLGAFLASLGWAHAGWSAVCALGLVLSLIALGAHLLGQRRN
ncbi:MFS transporter [Pseudomonas izuensis]|uniref:MFS transporter n=1 Tax=Pseudomonas izuensis TaxID=2684212 RepID=UPI00135CAE71|nr:MFS transporter [Pseudomonas izuensis]